MLAEIKPNQAMRILYDLDTAKDKAHGLRGVAKAWWAEEMLQDPTNWIIAEARKRRQGNEVKGKARHPSSGVGPLGSG